MKLRRIWHLYRYIGMLFSPHIPSCSPSSTNMYAEVRVKLGVEVQGQLSIPHVALQSCSTAWWICVFSETQRSVSVNAASHDESPFIPVPRAQGDQHDTLSAALLFLH